MPKNRFDAARKKELDALAAASGGVIYPDKLVAQAKSKSSEFHNDFDWSDTVAGAKWRLHQARGIISYYLTVVDAPGPREVRAYISLTTDRSSGGGYRRVRSVLSNKKMRAQLLADAFDEFTLFKAKYVVLKELAGVFEAIEDARKKYSK